MHESIAAYLTTLSERRKSPHTLKATRQDLTQFVRWWERQNGRPFDPALLLDSDLRDWRRARQQHDGAAPATINRALSTLRGYCAWAVSTGLTSESAARDIEDVPTPELAPRGLPAPAVKALLRAARAEPDVTIRLRDEAALALLIYGGLVRTGGLQASTVRRGSGWPQYHRALQQDRQCSARANPHRGAYLWAYQIVQSSACPRSHFCQILRS